MAEFTTWHHGTRRNLAVGMVSIVVRASALMPAYPPGRLPRPAVARVSR